MANKGQFQTVLGVARIGAMLIGAASVTVGVGKLAVPLYQHLMFTAFPAAWAGFRSLLAPPYLFLLVNLIILVIWKLSERRTPDHNLQHFRQEPGVVSNSTTTTATPVQPKIVHAAPDVVAVPSPRAQHVPPPLSYSFVDNGAMPSPRKPAAAATYIQARQTLPPPQKPTASIDEDSQPRVATPRNPSHNRRPPSPDTNSDDSCVTAEDDSSMEYHSPEPIISPLIRHRRLAAIATPARSAPVSPYHPTFGGGGGPDQLAADAPESIEDAWRAITRSGAATPRLRKNETWGVAPRVVQMQPPPARREMRKSETFNDAAATRRRAAGAPAQGVAWDRTERDEMNQKFEAFIKKMNDDLRMQRQESAAQRKIDTTLRRGY